MHERNHSQTAFTIVELLIVIVVIAILAAIVFVAYRGINDRAEIAVVESDLNQASKQLAADNVISSTFPADLASANEGRGLSASSGVSYQYTSDGSDYCLTATKGDKAYFITNSTSPAEGACDGHDEPGGGGEPVIADGVFIQDITSANCPTTRTRAVDARDNHTYWVQELADGKCWMLTNLAYAGGGTNTYGDTKTLTNGSHTSDIMSPAYYYVVPFTTNYTTEPTNPSSSTNGTGQYGYLYNWCGAMGGQLATGACAATSTPLPDTNISVCPDGWRLPTGNGGEFGALNTAINGGSTGTDAGLRTNWLAQRSGARAGEEYPTLGTHGYYWSSTQAPTASYAYRLVHSNSSSAPASNNSKVIGMAVRCLAT